MTGPGAPVAGRAAWYWAPVLLWLGVIWTLSGEPFSAAHTSRWLDPVLRLLFPGLSPADLRTVHALVRKTAHFVEFFVLGALLYRALRRGRPPAWQARLALGAVALAALWALVDEFRQSLVPDRTASLLDCVIDATGAAASQAVNCLRLRLRGAAE